MKVKMFTSSTVWELQKEINEWLDGNKGVSIFNILQSGGDDSDACQVVVSIFYQEKAKTPAKKTKD